MGIFEPYRALGYITDNIPFVVQQRGLENFVTVSVGKAFQIFNCAKLSLVFVAPQLEKRIRSLACWRDYTYAAAGRSIFVFRRAQQVAQWSAHQSKIVHIVALGDHILSADSKGWIFVWEATNLEKEAAPVRNFFVEEPVLPTCLMHPDAYLNKVIVGTEEGSLFLWNISTGKLLYKFKGWGSPIRCCVSSPALDVVGIGCGDGKIYVHNLRFDETVTTFSHTTRGSVTALSFRTDGQPILAAGGSSGVISIWNLEKQKLQGVIKDAHESAVCALYFLSNEPVLLSAAADNSIKMWIFDSNDGEARLLRFRSGHSAPPAFMRYYGSGRHILSAGHDRAFRMFSTIQDQQSRELSQGHIAKRAKKLKLKEEELKLPPVVCFDAAEIRERDWCNVVTCHVDCTVAYTWRLQNFVIGEQILKPTVGTNHGSVEACALSSCGNFAIIGTEAGHVERFNIQSGLSRQIYHDASLNDYKAHEGAVVGLACDGTNNLIISGSYDCHVKVWSFKGGQEKSRWLLGSPLVKMIFNRGSGLLATVSYDLVLRVYDVEAAKLVRMFEGHKDRVTDLCFSEDGKWLLSSAMDGTIRVWDVVSSKQLDAMRVVDPVTSLSLSPSMDMLATTHIGHNGIYLWGNRLIYTSTMDYENAGSGKRVVDKSLPTVPSAHESTENCSFIEDPTALKTEQRGLQQEEEDFTTSSQIMPQLVTLSLLPKAQWQSLLHLDIIKMRNKPVEPPKKPKKAPFFLPSLPSLSGDPTFVNLGSVGGGKRSETEEKRQHLSTKNTAMDGDSSFIRLLYSCSESKDFGNLLLFLKGLSPSEVDLEFQMLRVVDDLESMDESRGKQLQEIGLMLDFLTEAVSSRRDFEFVHGLTRLFLKVHGETILQQSTLQEKAKLLSDSVSASWERLDHMFQNVRCTLSFLSNALY
ncbi:hypothetical protein GOP47_0004054 [Adiantum capillus-veneris]|uniref:Uncharacterized protein n=1 Tax=Adiantum capillus-veneris TaxID=13818 RepID=A0A9D4V7X2_ADICA|nr:hypothetical protein GOP47_0004054 [Adiantum capillus-veneris]